MERDLVSLINKIQSKRGEDAFEVSNNPISEALNQEKDLKIIYDEGDLTKNFVRFATDLVTKARLTIKFYSLEKGRDQTWTMELIMKEAEKYDSITAFGRGNPSAYSAAIKLGIREAIIIAMKKRKHGMIYEQAIKEKMKTL